MNCKVLTNDLLESYLQHHLEQAEKTEIDHHLAACGRCKTRTSEISAITQTLKQVMGQDSPEALLKRLDPVIQGEMRRICWDIRSARSVRRWRFATFASIAAAAGLLVALALLLHTQMEQSSDISVRGTPTAPEETVKPAAKILGDILEDGGITCGDISLFHRKVLSESVVDPAIGDLNHDGKVDVADLWLLENMVLNK